MLVQVNQLMQKNCTATKMGLMFSSLLPRRKFRNMASIAKGITKTKAVNRMLRSFTKASGWGYITHMNISPFLAANFCPQDDVHLSQQGINLFMYNITSHVKQYLQQCSKSQ